MSKVMIEINSKVEVDIDVLAKCFCGLDDDQQCQFFVKVAEEAKTWKQHQEYQWILVGGHLRNCKRSSNEARELIESIYYGLKNSTHGAER